jgi:hypothetical protein
MIVIFFIEFLLLDDWRGIGKSFTKQIVFEEYFFVLHRHYPVSMDGFEDIPGIGE